MPVLVLALGLLTAAFGLLFMAIGWPIVQVERGWSMVIAGATMLSGGLVTAALGLVLQAVERLPVKMGTRGLVTRESSSPPAAGDEPRSIKTEAPPLAPEPKLDVTVEKPQPVEAIVAEEAPSLADRPHPVRRMPGPKVFEVPPPPSLDSAPDLSKSVEVSTKDKTAPPPSIDDWLDRDRNDEELKRDDLVEAPTQPDIETNLAPEVEPAAPTSAVVGRYEADGTSYVMYADGSIEAQSPTGVYRFSSMAELKAFIEG